MAEIYSINDSFQEECVSQTCLTRIATFANHSLAEEIVHSLNWFSIIGRLLCN
jgi:hypothetical protein